MDEEIASDLAVAGLEDMIRHFLTRHTLWLKDGRTWYICRGVQGVGSRTKYMLDTDRCLL